METKCGTRYLNAALPYGPLCQYNYRRGVEEMEIMSCYLWALESSSASVTKLQLLTEKFQLKCQVWLKTCSWKLSHDSCKFIAGVSLIILKLFPSVVAVQLICSCCRCWQPLWRTMLKVSRGWKNFRWAVLCGLQMALVVFSCSNLRFPHTLHLQIQLVRGKEPGVTGLWLPI